MKNRFFLLWVAALLLSGCAGVTTPPPAQVAVPDAVPQDEAVQDKTPQLEIPGEITQEDIPQPSGPQPSGEGAIVEPVPEPVVSGNSAVIALLDRARIDTEAGRRDAAGALLERALRIEPRNPWLWHKLAQLRLVQGRYAQGISLARKSISFAGQDRRLQALNWQVIGNARVAQGSPAEAEQAFKLATELGQAAAPEQGAEAVRTAPSTLQEAPPSALHMQESPR